MNLAISNNTTNIRGYLLNTYAEYENGNTGSHYIKFMAGFNQELQKSLSLSGTGYGLITSKVPNINTTIGTRTSGSSGYEYSLRGIFSRLNHIFKNRYLVELNARYDGTSRFPRKDRFGFFPSASIGWRISEESFMAGTRDILNNFKIRASYGSLGNQSIVVNGIQQYYPYLSSMSVGESQFILNNTRILYVSAAGLVSPTLTWEKIITKDIGLDFSLFDDKLEGAFDYYSRKTKDMLLSKIYPSILATSAPKENAAELVTNGWEFSLNWRSRISNDFTYDLRFSIWDSKSKITKYINTSGTLSDYYEGKTIGEIWGYETYGLFQSIEEVASSPSQTSLGTKFNPGDVRYKDQNNDGKIDRGNYTIDNHGDLNIIGNSSPRLSYGIDIVTNYKSWSLMLFFQGIGKRDYYPGVNFGSFWPNDPNNNIKVTDITDSWTEENKDAYWYRATTDYGKNRQSQTRYLQNAAYLRLKSLVLSYSLPSIIINKLGISSAQIYASGQNLWTHSKMVYNRDPEAMTGNTYDPTYTTDIVITYPFQRTFSIGVNLNF